MTANDMKILMAIYDRQYEIVSELINLYGNNADTNVRELSQKGINFLCEFAKVFNDEKEV